MPLFKITEIFLYYVLYREFAAVYFIFLSFRLATCKHKKVMEKAKCNGKKGTNDKNKMAIMDSDTLESVSLSGRRDILNSDRN